MTNALEKLNKLAGVVILAGGASSRMGSPKALLSLPTAETLLNYHVRQAAKLNVPIMIADNGRDFKIDAELVVDNPELPITHIADYESISVVDNEETEGPLVAIEPALQTLNNLRDVNLNNKQTWLLVISCDSLINAHELWLQLKPFIDAEANNETEKSVICLTDDSHLYPLLGLYRLSIEPKLRAYIDSGERKVMSFVKPIAKTVPVLEKQQLLTNFNTPEDFRHACTTLYNL